MPSDFQHIRHTLPKFRKRDYAFLMKSLYGSLGFAASDIAKFRLHVLEHGKHHGWKSATEAFRVPKTTYFRWRAEFRESGDRLNSLVPGSTRPINVRRMETDLRLVELIRVCRCEMDMRMSKTQIKPLVDALSRTLSIKTISETTIGKIIKRKNLFDHKPKKKKQGRGTKNKIKKCPKITFPGYIQIDTIHLHLAGQKYYFYTFIDLATRFAWCGVSTKLSSRRVVAFFNQFEEEYGETVKCVQTDNGAEFRGEFEKHLLDRGIEQIFSYPRSPRVNGFVERFNRTIQEEFIDRNQHLLEDNILFTSKLNKYLNWYNHERPHQSLNRQTPVAVLKQLLTINQQPSIPKCG